MSDPQKYLRQQFIPSHPGKTREASRTDHQPLMYPPTSQDVQYNQSGQIISVPQSTSPLHPGSSSSGISTFALKHSYTIASNQESLSGTNAFIPRMDNMPVTDASNVVEFNDYVRSTLPCYDITTPSTMMSLPYSTMTSLPHSTMMARLDDGNLIAVNGKVSPVISSSGKRGTDNVVPQNYLAADKVSTANGKMAGVVNELTVSASVLETRGMSGVRIIQAKGDVTSPSTMASLLSNMEGIQEPSTKESFHFHAPRGQEMEHLVSSFLHFEQPYVDNFNRLLDDRFGRLAEKLTNTVGYGTELSLDK